MLPGVGQTQVAAEDTRFEKEVIFAFETLTIGAGQSLTIGW